MRRFFRIVLIIFAVIIILIFAIQYSLDFFLNKKIIEQVQQQVEESSGGLYHVSIKKIRINLFNQSVSIGEIKVVADTSRAHGQVLYTGGANYIRLIHFSLISYIRNRDIVINKIELQDPSLRIYRDGAINNTKGDTTHFSLYNLVSGFCSSITIKGISINNSDIRLYSSYKDTTTILRSNNNLLRVKNMRINKLAADSRRLFMADTFSIAINNFRYRLDNDLYDLKCKNFYASYSDSLMYLDSVQLVPLYNKREFAYAAGKQTDRIDIYSSGVVFNKVNVKSFFERSALHGRKLNIHGLVIHDFRDLNVPAQPKAALSIQQLIRNIPFYINIDSIQMTRSEMAYEEVAEGVKKSGRVSFNKLDALITGFNNDTSILSANKILRITATALLMNAGKAHLNYSFPLNTNKVVFDCWGRLGPMPFTAFNPMLVTNTGMEAKDGFADSMSFHFHANEQNAIGSIRLFYHDLHIDLVNKDQKKGVITAIKSFYADKFILKKENPEKNKTFRTGNIFYVYVPEKFLFSYTWKALLTGIESTLAPGKKLNL